MVDKSIGLNLMSMLQGAAESGESIRRWKILYDRRHEDISDDPSLVALRGQKNPDFLNFLIDKMIAKLISR